jgi:methionine-gamma-lyase
VELRSQEFIGQLKDVNSGASMLLDLQWTACACQCDENLRTLHLRIQHSHNAAYLAERFEKDGLKTVYPGLQSHPSHKLFASMINPEYGLVE